MKQIEIKRNDNGGYVIMSVLILVVLALTIGAGFLTSVSTNVRTEGIVSKHSYNYYDAETVLNTVVSWMQSNSKSLVHPFTSDEFAKNFDLGDPAVGDNEGTHFSTPTLIKAAGTNDSILLSTNPYFGTSSFPISQDIDSGEEFDPVSAFESADFGGESNARVILVWARETGGNYEPVYRVDVINGNNPDRGVHSYSYIYSNLVTTDTSTGFYGQTSFATQTGNNVCWSRQWTYAAGVWSSGANRSNCPVASDGTISLRSNINGTAKTLTPAGITLIAPSGAVSGTQCAAAGCHTLALPAHSSWTTVCNASNMGDVTLNDTNAPAPAHTLTLSVSGATAAQQCWRDITVPANKTLMLNYNGSSWPFRFRTITLQNNSNSRIRFQNMPSGNKITMYVERFTGDRFNGNQFINTNNAPHQVELNMTGAYTLLLNGTAAFRISLIAPYSAVTLNGNFVYHGGIRATSISMIGNAVIYYDEALGSGPTLSDIVFSANKATQRYR